MVSETSPTTKNRNVCLFHGSLLHLSWWDYLGDQHKDKRAYERRELLSGLPLLVERKSASSTGC